jgi:hypothetical protein
MVVDNCGCHKKAEVVAAFEKAGFHLKFFPANMTGELQPRDLVVNAVCKKALRKLRIGRILDYFREYKVRALIADAAGQDLPLFTPPVPKMVDGVLGLMETTFAEPEFKASLYLKMLQESGPHSAQDNRRGRQTLH